MLTKPQGDDPGAGEERHLELPRGFHDVSPDRMAIQLRVQEEWFGACRMAGYQAVEVAPVGFASTFTTGHHGAGERFYRFPDRRGRHLALVSDSLPAVLRFSSSRRLSEQRLSYCCPVFRYERKRRRYFHHLGLMEVSSRTGGLAAQVRSTRRLAEVVTDFLVPYFVPEFTITDPGLWYELLGHFLPSHKSAEYLNLLRRMPAEARPIRLRADGAPETVVDVVRFLSSAHDRVPARARTEGFLLLPPSVERRIAACQALAEALRRRGTVADIDLNELHASEFHDGPSFLLRNARSGLLGDGGCYGRFASTFLGSPSPVAVNAAVVGLERMVDFVSETSQNDLGCADLAVLAANEPNATEHADRLTASLRHAGLSVWDLVVTRPIRHHLRDLADLAIPYSVLVGNREVSSTSYSVRDRVGNLHVVTRQDLARWLISEKSASQRRP